jgi:uncharacterized protein YcbK (DUF882 family)
VTLNKVCHLCSGLLRPLMDIPGWVGCSCGVRRMEKEIVNLTDYITASGKYKDRLLSPELTKEIKDNAIVLLNRVNQLLKELGVTSVSVSSGFRPSAVNAKIKGSAKKSLHLLGKAIDILDPNHELYKKIEAKPELLKKYGLWMEHKDNAPTWVHLDISSLRTDRPVRIFRA